MGTYAIFLLFSPLFLTLIFNIVSGVVSEKRRYLLAFSLVVVFVIIAVWPGGAELSRKAFYLLGIGGEIPVQIALLPGDQLGLAEGIIKQNGVSGSIYERTIGPFRLILYGKEKVYLSAMNDQRCLPDRAGTTLANASCQRIFSIPSKYIASIDVTKSILVDLDSSR